MIRTVALASLLLAALCSTATAYADDAQLIRACQRTEVTAPDSCACTVAGARRAKVSDMAMASLFKDDAKSAPVDQSVYGRFWQVKAQCIAEATMAKLGISQDNPLPGVAAHMPSALSASSAANAASAPAGNPYAGAPPAQANAPSALAPLGRAEDVLESLRGTGWEYTEEDGEWHRYDFLPDGKYVVERMKSGSRPEYASVMELEPGSTSGNIIAFSARYIGQTTGTRFNIEYDGGDTMVYHKSFVRTAERWPFKRAGAAKIDLPERAPKPIGDTGLWEPYFGPIDFNGLAAQTSGSVDWFQRGLKVRAFNASVPDIVALRLAHEPGHGGCSTGPGCELRITVQPLGSKQRQTYRLGQGVRKVGVQAVGKEAMRIVVFGPDIEWQCERGKGCRQTANHVPAISENAVAPVSKEPVSLADRLFSMHLGPPIWDGPVDCDDNVYLRPANKSFGSYDAIWDFLKNHQGPFMASGGELGNESSFKTMINIDGKPREVRQTGGGPQGDQIVQTYEGRGVKIILRTGPTLTDNPAYGGSVGEAEITVDAVTEIVPVVTHGVC